MGTSRCALCWDSHTTPHVGREEQGGEATAGQPDPGRLGATAPLRLPHLEASTTDFWSPKGEAVSLQGPWLWELEAKVRRRSDNADRHVLAEPANLCYGHWPQVHLSLRGLLMSQEF